MDYFIGKTLFISNKIHYILFRNEMGDEMKEFVKNLSWSFFGGMIAASVMFFVNIVAGRILGPTEFGLYNYFLSLASSITFFFLLGNNQSGIRYIADNEHKERQNQILSAVFFLTAFQSIVFFIISFIFKNYFSAKFNLSVPILSIVFLLGLIFSFRELFDSFLRSLGLFKKQSIIKTTESIVVLVSFFVFFGLQKNNSYINYVWAILLGASFSFIIALIQVKERFVKFDLGDIYKILHYNKFLILAGVGGLVMTMEKIFIGKYMGFDKLGVYSAYYASSQMIISNLGILFMNIFWPTVIKNKHNLLGIIKKLEKVIFKFLPLWAVLNFVAISLFVLMYGKQYAFQISLVTLFTFSSLLNIYFFIYSSILNIEKVSYIVIINTLMYCLFLISIVVFKNISAYLISQIIIYITGIVYVRNLIYSNAYKNA